MANLTPGAIYDFRLVCRVPGELALVTVTSQWKAGDADTVDLAQAGAVRATAKEMRVNAAHIRVVTFELNQTEV